MIAARVAICTKFMWNGKLAIVTNRRIDGRYDARFNEVEEFITTAEYILANLIEE